MEQNSSLERLKLVADSCTPLTFFPDIKPDETLYSVCARYHYRSGYSDSATTSARLLGHIRGGKQHDLLVGIAKLSKLTEGAIPANEVTLRKRTVLRAYLPLMSTVRRAKVVDACLRSTNSLLAKSYAGLSAGANTTHSLRHCQECLEAQRTEHGFEFWLNAHQLPGVWVCPLHQRLLMFLPDRGKKRADWMQVGSNKLQELPPEAIAVAGRLARVSSAMQWLGSAERLNVDALAIMIRARLHSSRYARSDVKTSEHELNCFHQQEIRPLPLSGVSHFRAMTDASWISSCLRDERSSHPLKWAVLLSTTGDADFSTLSSHYRTATERLSQPELFEDSYRPRRARAPEAAYAALTGPVTVADAARASGMRVSELEGWIRRDEMLAQHWRTTDFDVRRRAAIFTIQGCKTENPKIMRSQVISRCLWAVRWLEQNDRQLLNLLLPEKQSKYDRQLRLQLDQ